MAEPRNGNGMEASLAHLGSLKFSGRDVLLVGALMILGAAAIAVQWMTLTTFQQALARDITQVFRQADRADVDRAQILGMLRARSCGEALRIAPESAKPDGKETKP